MFIRPSCKKRVRGAGSRSCPGWGGRQGVPSSLTRLFIWQPVRPFLQLLFNVLSRRRHPPPRRWAGLTNRLPPLAEVPISPGPTVPLAFTAEMGAQALAVLGVLRAPTRAQNRASGAEMPGLEFSFCLYSLCASEAASELCRSSHQLPLLILQMGKLRLGGINSEGA